MLVGSEWGVAKFLGKKLDGLAGGGGREKAGMRQGALAGHKSSTHVTSRSYRSDCNSRYRPERMKIE